MQGELLTRIRANYNQFTKAEKRVADYIIENPEKVLFMSITELAESCSVGDTSVFRFCKTMELKGYQEFKMRLSLSMNDGEKKLDQYAGNITLEDSFQDLAKKILNNNINALTETFSLLDEGLIRQAIERMHQAKRIYFFGVGASMLTAMKAMNKFLHIEPKVYCIQDSHMQAMAASTMGPEDAAVLISYSGATKDTIHVARQAKEAGAVIICITRFIKSPLTAFSDITLLCGANEGPLQGGSTSAELSQMYLIDLLFSEYYRRYFEQCRDNNKKTSESVVEKMC